MEPLITRRLLLWFHIHASKRCLQTRQLTQELASRSSSSRQNLVHNEIMRTPVSEMDGVRKKISFSNAYEAIMQETDASGTSISSTALKPLIPLKTTKLSTQFINQNTKVLDTRSLSHVHPQTLHTATKVAEEALETVLLPASNNNSDVLLSSASMQQGKNQMEGTRENSTIEAVNVVNHAMHLNLLVGNYTVTIRLFEQLERSYVLTPTVVSKNHMLHALIKAGDIDKALIFYKTMRKEQHANIISLGNIVHGLALHRRIDEAFELVERWEDTGAKLTQPVFTSLIKGCVDTNQMDRAWKTYYDMQFRYFPADEITYSLMMKTCAQAGDAEKALNLFDDMRNRGLYPTTTTFNTLLYALSKRSDFASEAQQLYQQMSQSTSMTLLGTETRFVPDNYTFGYLMAACRKTSDWKMGHMVWCEAQRWGCVDSKLVEMALWTLANAGRSWRPKKLVNSGTINSTEFSPASSLSPMSSNIAPCTLVTHSLPSNVTEKVDTAIQIPTLAVPEEHTAYLRLVADQLFSYATRLFEKEDFTCTGNIVAKEDQHHMTTCIHNAYLSTFFPHFANSGYEFYQQTYEPIQITAAVETIPDVPLVKTHVPSNGTTHLLVLSQCMSSVSEEWRMRGVTVFQAWEQELNRHRVEQDRCNKKQPSQLRSLSTTILSSLERQQKQQGQNSEHALQRHGFGRKHIYEAVKLVTNGVSRFHPNKALALLFRLCREHQLVLEKRDYGELLRYTRFSSNPELAHQAARLLDHYFRKESELERQFRKLRRKWDRPAPNQKRAG